MTDLRPRHTRVNGAAPAPYDDAAEAFLLGSAMLDVRAAATVARLPQDVFYRPLHARISEAIRTLIHQGITPTPAEVGVAMKSGGSSLLAHDGELVTIQNLGSFGDAASTAEWLLDVHRARRAQQWADEIQSAALDLDISGLDTLLQRTPAATSISTVPPDIDAFLAETDQPHRWLVPELLERMDRLVLVGAEGRGKSTLLRQIGVQLAAGIHPFTLDDLQPVSVLLVDMENSADQLRRSLRSLRGLCGSRAVSMRVVCHPQGCDLLGAQDAAWLAGVVASVAPDLLITGPTYKMAAGDPDKEETVSAILRVLDRIRVANDCAIMLEAHEGHAQSGSTKRPGRPIGSSVWLRWPEFGLELDVDENRAKASIRHFRWGRDTRLWPSRLGRGDHGTWPWLVIDDTPSAPVDLPPYDGIEAAKVAVGRVLEACQPNFRGTNELLKEVRASGLRARDCIVKDAAQALADVGWVQAEQGPNRSIRYRWTSA